MCRGEAANQWNKRQGAYLTFIPVLLFGTVSGSHILQTPVRENLKSREVVVVVTRRLKMKHFKQGGEGENKGKHSRREGKGKKLGPGRRQNSDNFRQEGRRKERNDKGKVIARSRSPEAQRWKTAGASGNVQQGSGSNSRFLCFSPLASTIKTQYARVVSPNRRPSITF